MEKVLYLRSKRQELIEKIVLTGFIASLSHIDFRYFADCISSKHGFMFFDYGRLELSSFNKRIIESLNEIDLELNGVNLKRVAK